MLRFLSYIIGFILVVPVISALAFLGSTVGLWYLLHLRICVPLTLGVYVLVVIYYCLFHKGNKKLS